jgi:putative effector of murein hydrolase
MEISRLIGGAPAVTATLTIMTGIIGAVGGPYVLNASRIRTPEARGFAMGIASHGIATARAVTESESPAASLACAWFSTPSSPH